MIFCLQAETVSQNNWHHHVKSELKIPSSTTMIPSGALSPPATLSPPSSPSVQWSPGQHHPAAAPMAVDRLSAFSLVSNGYDIQRLQALTDRGKLLFLFFLV